MGGSDTSPLGGFDTSPLGGFYTSPFGGFYILLLEGFYILLFGGFLYSPFWRVFMVDVNVSVGHRCHGYVYIWLYVDMQISRDLDVFRSILRLY